MARLNTMSSVRNVFILASRAFGYQSCFVESIRKPDSEGRIIRNGGTPIHCSKICYKCPGKEWFVRKKLRWCDNGGIKAIKLVKVNGIGYCMCQVDSGLVHHGLCREFF